MAKDDKNKNLFQKLTRLFKSGPVVRRKLRNLDTTIVVPDKTKSSGALLFQKSTAPTYATITANAYNLSERLMRYQDFCFSGDTLVYTLEGVHTIAELAKKYTNGEQFYVYSYDYEKKIPTIGKAFFPRIVDNGAPKKLLKITFDGGGHLCLTPDHKLILRDGSTREAKDLVSGDSLMPLYISDINKKGYNWVYMLGEKTNHPSGWLQEHVLVASNLLRTPAPGEHVYHKDFLKKNNHPSNLVIMPEHDRQKYHAQLNSQNKLVKANLSYSRRMRGNDNWRQGVTFSSIVDACNILGSKKASDVINHLNVDIKSVKLSLREFGYSSWKDFVFRFDDAQAASTHETIKRETRSPDFQEIFAATQISKSIDEVAARLSCTRNAIDRRLTSAGYKSWLQLKTGSQYLDKKRGPIYAGPTYQTICAKHEVGMTKLELAAACETTQNEITTCLKNEGYTSYSKWSENFKNHKVVSVEEVPDASVFNITVEKHHNLAVGSFSTKDPKKCQYSMVFATQCEMEYTPEIAAALDIYADETVSQDEKGRSLHIYSDNEKIKEILEDLFYNTLNVEFNLRSWSRNLVKYGDFFLYNDVSPTHGVINAFPIPVNELEREENYDPNDPMAVRFRWVTLGNRTLENWEVSHFRLLGNDMFLPYGSSVIEPARRIWRQLILIEDAMLVYRVVRAPERRVFYIDVANIPPENVPMYVEEQRKNLRSSQVIDRTTGRVDLRYNPLSVDEDYFIPVRGGESGTKIDTLAGGQNAAAVEDVAYIQKKLFAALKIPRAYLGYDESLSSKATLAQEDIRFSRTINVIQKTLISELNKLAIIHLYANGFDSEDLQNFTLRLSNPSAVAQQQKLELWRAKFEIAGSAPEGQMSKEFIRKEIWGLNDDQCAAIDDQRLKEKIVDATIEAAQAEDEDGAEVSTDDKDIFGSEEGEEETTPDESSSEGDEEGEDLFANDDVSDKDDVTLLTSGDDPDDDEDFPAKISLRDVDVPVKAQRQLDRALYNRSRVRHHGASKTHMPDFAKMVSHDSKSISDPHDFSWMKSYLSNPLGESTATQIHRTHISNDVLITLRNMTNSKKFQSVMPSSQSTTPNSILSESEDLDIADATEHDDTFIIDDDDGDNL